MGAYGEEHSVDDCDKCGDRAGKDNLIKIPWLFLDRNDDKHPDAIDHPRYKDYKQYYVCKKCYDEGF